MRVDKPRITPYKDFSYVGPIDLSSYINKKERKPLLGVPSCEVDFLIYLGEDDHLYCNYAIEAKLVLEDSRTLEPFEVASELEDSIEILSSPLEEGEGYIFEGQSFDLEELVLAIIMTSLPIAPRKEDSPLPSSTEDYNVYLEGQEKEEELLILEEEGEEEGVNEGE